MSLLLEVKNLSKTYGEKKVVDQLRLCINKGEILGFLGPNGAGKSTTIKMIIDVETPDEGERYFDPLCVSLHGRNRSTLWSNHNYGSRKADLGSGERETKTKIQGAGLYQSGGYFLKADGSTTP